MTGVLYRELFDVRRLWFHLTLVVGLYPGSDPKADALVIEPWGDEEAARAEAAAQWERLGVDLEAGYE